MKEIGRINVTKEMLDVVFDKEHTGTSISTTVDKNLCITGFVLYDMEDGSYHIKVWDKDGADYYTSSQCWIRAFMRYVKSTYDVDAIDKISLSVTTQEGKSNKGRRFLTIFEAPSEFRARNEWKTMNW